MNLFYKPDLEIENTKGGWDFTLFGEEARHCLKVLRLTTGDRIHLTDGKGHLLVTEIIETDKKSCKLLVMEVKNETNRNLHLHIAIAPPKNTARLEWFLEKATEMGIEEITPILCERSVRDKLNIELARRIVTSAMKQSLKTWHPQVNEVVAFEAFLEKSPLAQKFIAFYEDHEQLLLKDAYQKDRDVVVIIGPEGDFTDKEIALAKEYGFETVSLGNTRLRTETAALASCFTVNLINQ